VYRSCRSGRELPTFVSLLIFSKAFEGMSEGTTVSTPKVIMNFGQAIRTVRENRGLSQRRLASEMDVSHSYISHIEKGARDPSLKVLTKITDVLNVPLHVLTLFAANEMELRGLTKEQAWTLGTTLLDETSWNSGEDK
jgi:transcriptional regulator with XRE-family HTH domain